MEEIWKDIAGYEGSYQVSNLGRVRSLERMINKWDGKRLLKGRILMPAENMRGYYFVTLYRNSHKTPKNIHRLVAEAFIPNPKRLPHINHKDENKSNNHLENLEWCDAQYNNCYGTRTQRVTKANSKSIVVYDNNGSEYEKYSSIHSAAKAFNVSPATICRYTHQSKASPLGFIFKAQ